MANEKMSESEMYEKLHKLDVQYWKNVVIRILAWGGVTALELFVFHNNSFFVAVIASLSSIALYVEYSSSVRPVGEEADMSKRRYFDTFPKEAMKRFYNQA